MDLVEGDRDKVLLYLIRAIRKYLAWKEQYHPACTAFLSQMTKRKKQVSRKIISFWITSVINHAYGSVTDEDCRVVKVKVHEVWKISTVYTRVMYDI